MEINSLWKLIACQGLGAAVVGNSRNWKCVFWREVIDTQAAEKFCVCHRCPASHCDSEIVGETRVCSVGKASKTGRRKALGAKGCVIGKQ